MFDTEQSSVPDSSNDQAYADVMAQAESLDIESGEPVETPAIPADKAPDTPPVETPAPTETAPPDPSPPASDAPADPPADAPKTNTPFTFKVDQREVALTGAYEDGDNIVIPKATWHSEAKNFLADRSQIRQMTNDWQAERRTLTEQRTVRDQTASALLADLQRIVELPEAESFGEWEKLRAEYPKKRLELENKALTTDRTSRETQDVQRYEAQVIEEHVTPRLQDHLRGAITAELQQAHQDTNGLIDKLPEGERQKARQSLEARIYGILWDEAAEGRLYFRNGEIATLENGVKVPDVVPDVQRIARVVKREVEGMREALDLRVKFATIDKAARENAAKAAARQTPVPPAISAKGTVADPVKDKEPKSWDEVVEAAQHIS